jgi:hypothetical protein
MRPLDPAGPNETTDNHHQTTRTSPITHPYDLFDPWSESSSRPHCFRLRDHQRVVVERAAHGLPIVRQHQIQSLLRVR